MSHKTGNRGGINNVTFDVFLAIEQEDIERWYSVELTDEVMTTIACSEDVLWMWF